MNTSKWYEFVEGVTARVNQVIDQTEDLTPSFLESGLFEVIDNPEAEIYRTQGVTGFSYLDLRGEQQPIQHDETYPAYKTEYAMKSFGKQVSISQRLMKTRQQQLEDKLNEVRQLVMSGNRTLKKHAWQVVADGFSATDTNANFPVSRLSDGVSMFAANHPSRVPGVGNRSNRLSGDGIFSESTAFDLINIVREQTNGRGLEIGYEEGFVFLVPPALEKTAKEIFQSQMRSGTANNDMNYFEGIHDFMSITYLSNASTGIAAADTSFYCFAKDAPNKALKYVPLIAPKVETEKDFDTKTIKVSIDGDWAMGYSHWEYCAASDGTND
jgi:hypothetical protein